MTSRSYLCFCRMRAFCGGWTFSGGDRFQLVAKRPVVTPIQSAPHTLPLARLNQMIQTTETHTRRFTTFRAAPVALHSQLILSLPGNRERREFILYAGSHSEVIIWHQPF